MRILLVEDHQETSEVICEVLRDAYYAVDLATSGNQADEWMDIHDFDLVILDWQIPEPDGLELLDKWRQNGHSLPILMLTVRDEVRDLVQGLDAGADDYLTKPFSIAELLARVRTLLRRRTSSSIEELEADDLKMDRSTHLVTVAGNPTELSPKEYSLLEYLLLHKDDVVSRADIESHIWDMAADPVANVVDVTIHRLRRKIDHRRRRRLLHTVRGVGYTLRSHRIEP